MGSICGSVQRCSGLRIGYAGCFMKNADLPAMPQNNSETLCQQTGTPHYMHSGLTKREYFAGLAMQSLAAESGRYGSTGDMAYDAVKLAGALLAELERTK